MPTIEEWIDLLVKGAVGSFAYFVFDSVMEMFFNKTLGPNWREEIKRYIK